MKMVMAIIRIDKMNETKKALAEIGCPSMTVYGKVHGRGKGKFDAKVIEGVRNDQPEAIELLGPEPPLRPHRMVQVICQSKKVKDVIDAIIDSNQTEKPGDGKIFVLPMTEVIRVRTQEKNDEALD